MTKIKWEKVNGDRLRDDSLKEVKIKLNAIREKAQSILSNIKSFSFYSFGEQFFENPKTKTNLSCKVGLMLI